MKELNQQYLGICWFVVNKCIEGTKLSLNDKDTFYAVLALAELVQIPVKLGGGKMVNEKPFYPQIDDNFRGLVQSHSRLKAFYEKKRAKKETLQKIDMVKSLIQKVPAKIDPRFWVQVIGMVAAEKLAKLPLTGPAPKILKIDPQLEKLWPYAIKVLTAHKF
jgi:hypothetical protein